MGIVMKPELPKLLGLLLEFAPSCLPETERSTGGSCIYAAKIAVGVLEYFGFQARPLTVRLRLVNAAYWSRWEAGGFEPIEESDEWWDVSGAYSVVIDSDLSPKPGAWNGHLVAIAEEQFLIDLSLSCFARPERRLYSQPIVEEIHDSSFLQGNTCWAIESGQGSRLMYEAKPGDQSYLHPNIVPDRLPLARQRTARRAISDTARSFRQEIDRRTGLAIKLIRSNL
jgi:hypothetical protein